MATKSLNSIIKKLDDFEFKILHRFAVSGEKSLTRSELARPLKMSKHNFDTALSTLTVLNVVEEHTVFTAVRGRNPQMYIVTDRGKELIDQLVSKGIIGK